MSSIQIQLSINLKLYFMALYLKRDRISLYERGRTIMIKLKCLPCKVANQDEWMMRSTPQ